MISHFIVRTAEGVRGALVKQKAKAGKVLIFILDQNDRMTEETTWAILKDLRILDTIQMKP